MGTKGGETESEKERSEGRVKSVFFCQNWGSEEISQTKKVDDPTCL